MAIIIMKRRLHADLYRESLHLQEKLQDITRQVTLVTTERMRICILQEEKISRSNTWDIVSNWKKSREPLRNLTEYQDAAVCLTKNATNFWDFILATARRKKFIRN